MARACLARVNIPRKTWASLRRTPTLREQETSGDPGSGARERPLLPPGWEKGRVCPGGLRHQDGLASGLSHCPSGRTCSSKRLEGLATGLLRLPGAPAHRRTMGQHPSSSNFASDLRLQSVCVLTARNCPQYISSARGAPLHPSGSFPTARRGERYPVRSHGAPHRSAPAAAMFSPVAASPAISCHVAV